MDFEMLQFRKKTSDWTISQAFASTCSGVFEVCSAIFSSPATLRAGIALLASSSLARAQQVCTLDTSSTSFAFYGMGGALQLTVKGPESGFLNLSPVLAAIDCRDFPECSPGHAVLWHDQTNPQNVLRLQEIDQNATVFKSWNLFYRTLESFDLVELRGLGYVAAWHGLTGPIMMRRKAGIGTDVPGTGAGSRSVRLSGFLNTKPSEDYKQVDSTGLAVAWSEGNQRRLTAYHGNLIRYDNPVDIGSPSTTAPEAFALAETSLKAKPRAFDGSKNPYSSVTVWSELSGGVERIRYALVRDDLDSHNGQLSGSGVCGGSADCADGTLSGYTLWPKVVAWNFRQRDNPEIRHPGWAVVWTYCRPGNNRDCGIKYRKFWLESGTILRNDTAPTDVTFLTVTRGFDATGWNDGFAIVWQEFGGPASILRLEVRWQIFADGVQSTQCLVNDGGDLVNPDAVPSISTDPGVFVSWMEGRKTLVRIFRETPWPTSAPSLSPSQVPSRSPTRSPTSSPTVAPSVPPTSMPIPTPTLSPIRSPTAMPPTRDPLGDAGTWATILGTALALITLLCPSTCCAFVVVERRRRRHDLPRTLNGYTDALRLALWHPTDATAPNRVIEEGVQPTNSSHANRRQQPLRARRAGEWIGGGEPPPRMRRPLRSGILHSDSANSSRSSGRALDVRGRRPVEPLPMPVSEPAECPAAFLGLAVVRVWNSLLEVEQEYVLNRAGSVYKRGKDPTPIKGGPTQVRIKWEEMGIYLTVTKQGVKSSARSHTSPRKIRSVKEEKQQESLAVFLQMARSYWAQQPIDIACKVEPICGFRLVEEHSVKLLGALALAKQNYLSNPEQYAIEQEASSVTALRLDMAGVEDDDAYTDEAGGGAASGT